MQEESKKNIKGIKVLFGGSFNPPTKAHYEIAKEVIDKFEVKEFVFLPTGNVYNKPNLIECKQRIAMLDLLCKKLKNASVSDYEMKQDVYLGTYKTLEHFKGFYFLMGADNFITLHQWINYPNVIINNKFIVVERNNLDLNEYINKHLDVKNNINNFLFYEDFKQIDISSSKFNQTKDYSLLLEEVADYIINHNLY